MLQTTPKEWASDLIRHGCTLIEVKKELEACMADPEVSVAVIHEFQKQILENMQVAKRGKEQYKKWKDTEKRGISAALIMGRS